jgi:hypothetical protein
MVQQVKDFEALAAELAELDCEIHVHGDGLLPHLAKMMMRAANPAHVVRDRRFYHGLPEGPVKGAEIGVFTGALSRELLKRDPDLAGDGRFMGGGRGYLLSSATAAIITPG